ncbi:MAG TPA: ATP-binding cassette domain-containing protein, partial [Acidimicrobiales bacterium]|nr:ATP-binding cassette domain-containing protein [Acidimicrobiales bacterium]
MSVVAVTSLLGFQVPLEVLVLGALTGLTYSLLAVGLVFAYKSSRVVNFAHGEMGALAAGVVPVLVVNDHVNYWVAVLLALLAAAATGVFVEMAIIRKFAQAPRLVVLVATIGASQLFFAVGAFIPKGSKLGTAVFPTPFRASVTVGSLRLGAGELLILMVVPVVTATLAFFLARTKLGLATRCAAENRDAAHLAGVAVGRVSLAVWTITGVLAGVSAILVGPTHPVVTQVAAGPGLLLRGLAAAMIAGMASLPLAFAGGVVIGLLEAIISWNYPSGGTLEVVLFALVILALLVRGGLGHRARGGEASSWSLAGRLRQLDPALARLPRLPVLKAGSLAGLAVVLALAALPATNSQRVLMSSVALFAAMGLSLVVLTGFAGQVSLGQFAFVGVGALVGGRMHQLGYSPWMALMYATAAGGVVALVIGLPALRIRGLFLAVATLAFAVATEAWLYGQRWLVHVSGARTSLELPRPRVAGFDLAPELHYYWLSLAVLAVLAAVTHRVRVTGVGRSMMAVRDNEAAAASMGVSPRRTKLVAFVIAGMMAAFAGYFYGGLLVSFSSRDTFAAELSLALVGFVMLGGVTTITGAVLGAVWLKGLAYVLQPILPGLLGSSIAFLIGGTGLLGALYAFPGGVAEVAFGLRDRALRRVAPRLGSARAPAGERPPPVARADSTARRPPAPGAPFPALEARDVSVRFGGNLAVAGVSMHVVPGEVVGLVGPNGAGKTTLFDVLSGHLRAASGHVLLEGQDVTRLRPEQRARLGLGRTFQEARLFEDVPLLDAVKVALERGEPSEVVPSVLGLAPARRAEQAKQLRAQEFLDLIGLAPYSHLYVADLSTGMRRLAELAAMAALGARVLLLDEPTAGIAQREVEAF